MDLKALCFLSLWLVFQTTVLSLLRKSNLISRSSGQVGSHWGKSIWCLLLLNFYSCSTKSQQTVLSPITFVINLRETFSHEQAQRNSDEEKLPFRRPGRPQLQVGDHLPWTGLLALHHSLAISRFLCLCRTYLVDGHLLFPVCSNANFSDAADKRTAGQSVCWLLSQVSFYSA